PTPGHFLKLATTFSGYFPLPFYKKIIFAATLRLGGIIQLAQNSTTYPDRFFFMGGIDSLRSFQQDSMLPQDAVDQINKGTLAATQVAIRGGNLLVNPRAEFRIPLTGPLETVVFFDSGNLWQDASYPFTNGVSFRAAVGTGIRVQTPVGPIALDYGFNLTRYTAYEDIGALNFAIGLF
ncbi:MAG TPA: BamA/TamA family outer membrane protein, partial [Polyangiaceae bacterium]|nr:BamA/TamA family outer membrane protein [Polyangiaceae bacterium]